MQVEEVITASAESNLFNDEVERRVAEIWSEVLEKPATDHRVHLFGSGGDSLKATQIISRIRDQWRTEFPLQLIFDGTGTIEGMAGWIRQSQERDKRETAPAIQPAVRNRELPLSYSQLRLWLGEQIEPGTPLYNICRTLSLKGTMNFAALERALQTIIQRHEILRTVYRAEYMPVQEVLPEVSISLPRHDLTGFPTPERRRIACNLIALEVSRPFDLATGPLLRMKLIHLGEEEQILVLVFHQIVTDAWSLELFFRELAILYAAFSAGEANLLPALAIQYVDYAVWQQRWFGDAALGQQAAYWRRQLSGALPELSLERKSSRAGFGHGALSVSNQGSVERLILKGPLLEKLRAFTAAEGVTLHVALLAVFKLLLHQCTGEIDIIVGSPESGRRRLETEPLLGCFVNTLVLRTQLPVGGTFREMLLEVRKTTLDAFAHADIPFEKLYQLLSSGGAMDRRFFQVWFGPIDLAQPFEMGELKAEPEFVFSSSAQFDLSVFVSETPGAVTCFFEYRKNVVTSTTVNRMVGCYNWLLSKVVATPQAGIRNLLEEMPRNEFPGLDSTEAGRTASASSRA